MEWTLQLKEHESTIVWQPTQPIGNPTPQLNADIISWTWVGEPKEVSVC